MKHKELILLLYKHRDLINRAYNGEEIENIPSELTKDIPIFQRVAKVYELSDIYMQFANTMLKRVDANYRFGDYNEEIKLLIEQKEIYEDSKDREILSRMKDLVRTLYKKIEHRDSLINSRINDIISDNNLSIELIIKDARDVEERIYELIDAHSENLNILGVQLKGLDDNLDEILINIGLDLIPLTENIHFYNQKLSDFILRTEKRKLENKQLLSLSNKIMKEQDHDLKSLLLSNHNIYHHTIKERSNGNLKTLPTSLELARDSFINLISSVLDIKKVDKRTITNKPYKKSEDTILKSVNLKKVKADLFEAKPGNIYEFILSHGEIQKFRPENQDKIFAFKVYLTIVQDYRANIELEENYYNNIKVAKWI
ncbi:hypothetical protein HUX57_11310 [Arcobacter butzleri]|uniref:hypothetical protein n=1 Tax=Aliarcobacter butzleri TaxID=28197 RepID=UPI001587DF0F|nr:hypothetical protein [Aliarcobacter butzleri]NUW27244.1 hypothetical protein [Aliarcobacter butzleri]